MLKSFKDKASQATFEAEKIKDVPSQFRHIAKRAWEKLDILDSAPNSKVCEQILGPKNYESLTGKQKGQHAIKINRQYRICFKWGTDNQVYEVEINKHYWD